MSTLLLALRNLLLNRRRSLTTLLAMVIGLVAVLLFGGYVRDVKYALQTDFVVTDYAARVTIRFHGILPDLFREGQGIVAMGKIDDSGMLLADEVLAKHDENYMPPEVKQALEQSGMSKQYEKAGEAAR